MCKCSVVALLVVLLASVAHASRQAASTESTSSLQRERQLQTTDPLCSWSVAERSCKLRQGFVGTLPGLMSTPPTTPSERILNDAASRARTCEGRNMSECAQAMADDCTWNSFTSSCGLADVLNLNALRNFAFCPGSPMEAALECALLTPSGPEACAASPFNCTTAATGGLTEATGGLGPELGDRLYDTVADMLLGAIVKSVAGADQLTSQLTSWLGPLLGALPLPNAQACVYRDLTQSVSLEVVAAAIAAAVRRGTGVLPSLLDPSLLGSCEGAQNFQSALAACSVAASPANCTATRGCAWSATTGSCAPGPTWLPDNVLDPSDKWVQMLSNATAVCSRLVDPLSCNAMNTRIFMDSMNSAIPGPASASGPYPSRGGSGGGSYYPGGSSPGAGTRPVALSWWALLAVSLAVVALAEGARGRAW